MSNIQNNSEELSDMVFPINSFPKPLLEIIEQFHLKMNLNYDFLGVSLIYALGLALGNSFKLRVRKKWIESPVTWCVIVGSAGINKSAPLSIMLEPFKKLDVDSFNKYKKKLEEFKIAQEDKNSKRKKDASEKTKKITLPPKRKQCLITDFTPEALSEAHDSNPRGIGIYADELLLFINNMNRYSKSGEEQFYLSTWSGMEVSINRKNGQHFYIVYPFIPIAGTIQPYKLAEAFGKGKDKSGYTHRMLFAFPDKVIREDLADDDVPDIYLNSYSVIINKIMAHSDITIQDGIAKPIIIDLDSNAQKLFKGWRSINDKRINEGTDEDIKGIYSKSESYLLRLSLILQIAEDTCSNSDIVNVSAKAFANAIEMIKYFEWSALKVNQLISRYHDPLSNYSMLQKMVYTALPTEFIAGKGEQIAKQLNMPRRTFYYFLKDIDLFEKQKQGKYLKKV